MSAASRPAREPGAAVARAGLVDPAALVAAARSAGSGGLADPGALVAGTAALAPTGRRMPAQRLARTLRGDRPAAAGRPRPLARRPGPERPPLPVLPALAGLLPERGLRRGSLVSVTGTAPGATALALALLAGPSQAGAWCAAVGVGSLGLVAAEELGVALERFALVADPGPDWPAVVAALVDALDVVAVRPPEQVRAADVRRLAARARERGAVLVPLGPPKAVAAWEGADVRLAVSAARWQGLGDGAGRLRARRVDVRTTGRGGAARPRRARLWLPGSVPVPVSLAPRPVVALDAEAPLLAAGAEG